MNFNDNSLSSAVIHYLRHFLLCVLVFANQTETSENVARDNFENNNA